MEEYLDEKDIMELKKATDVYQESVKTIANNAITAKLPDSSTPTSTSSSGADASGNKHMDTQKVPTTRLVPEALEVKVENFRPFMPAAKGRALPLDTK